MSYDPKKDKLTTVEDLRLFWRNVKNKLSGYVPVTRKLNGKALGSDVTLRASDVDALPTGGITWGDLKKPK